MKRYKWSFFIMLLIGIFAITGIHPASAQAKTNKKVTKAYMEKYSAIKKYYKKRKIRVSYALVNMKGLKHPLLLIQKKQKNGRKTVMIFRYQNKQGVVQGDVLGRKGLASKTLFLRTNGDYLLHENATINGYISNLYCWDKNFWYYNKEIQALGSIGYLRGYNEKKSSYLILANSRMMSLIPEF